MRAQDFWAALFRRRAALVVVASASPLPLQVAAGQAQLYGDFLGPSCADWQPEGCRWVFSRCRHGDDATVCDAHQGFLRGTLEAAGLTAVEVERAWRKPTCVLELTWRTP